MKSCDFSRSFVTFTIEGRGNNARIQVEARCVVKDAEALTSEEFFLVASCKSEDTYGDGVLFTEPNYDFCVIFSEEDSRIFRVGFPFDETKSTIHTNEERFEGVSFQIRMADAEVLATNEAIVKATFAGKVINGRTEIADPTGRYRAMIEFPVKTMNVNDIDSLYQTDTGPILVPDFEKKTDRTIERFALAFVAYNQPGEAYFILQEPVPGQAKDAAVADYSRIVRMDARNSIVAL